MDTYSLLTSLSNIGNKYMDIFRDMQGILYSELIQGTYIGNLYRELIQGTYIGNLYRELIWEIYIGNIYIGKYKKHNREK